MAAEKKYAPLTDRQIDCLQSYQERGTPGMRAWAKTIQSLHTRGLIEQQRVFAPDNPYSCIAVNTALTEAGKTELAAALKVQRSISEKYEMELPQRLRVTDPWHMMGEKMPRFRNVTLQRLTEQAVEARAAGGYFIEANAWGDANYRFNLIRFDNSSTYTIAIDTTVNKRKSLKSQPELTRLLENEQLFVYGTTESSPNDALKAIQEAYSVQGLEYMPKHPLIELGTLYGCYKGLFDCINGHWQRIEMYDACVEEEVRPKYRSEYWESSDYTIREAWKLGHITIDTCVKALEALRGV